MKDKSLLDRVREWVPLLTFQEVPRDWSYFKQRSIFPVKQEDFPPGLPKWTGGEYPCTDGATIWIPHGWEQGCIAMLLHETGHALLHYPDGPDPEFKDLERELASGLEAEACAAAYLSAAALGQLPLYNERYLAAWEGDEEAFGRNSKDRVVNAAKRMVARFSDISEIDISRDDAGKDRDRDCRIAVGESSTDGFSGVIQVATEGFSPGED